MINVLCASTKSIYHQLPGVEVYDQRKDARTCANTNPVIAHPPCRSYSAFMAHYAKPQPGERDLALFCAEKVLFNGGVLEHPAHSRFINRFKTDSRFKIHTVQQDWFGYPVRKLTWLLTPRHYTLPEIPFELMAPYKPGQQKKAFDNMSHYDRHKTTKQFAQWLIELVKINA
jgi:hypothetical protein